MKEIKRGQIWYADLDGIRGSEQGGRRPVLIVQNDIGNAHSPTTIIAVIIYFSAFSLFIRGFILNRRKKKAEKEQEKAAVEGIKAQNDEEKRKGGNA